MIFIQLTRKYSNLEAWLHDTLIADRALYLHAYLIEHSRLGSVFAEKRPRSLLDVGCGGGQSAIRLKGLHPYLEITGIDLSADQIERARQRAQRKGLALQFQAADAQCLPFPDASFDVVYSFGSAKHWPDPLKGFSESWRVLKPGGELFITDATCDATPEQVQNFYTIARFPRLLMKPVTGFLYRRMFRPACHIETYRQVAAHLGLPAETVSMLPEMPSFIFQAQKPA